MTKSPPHSGSASPADRMFWPILALILVAAALLRLAHFEEVWSYWTLDYLSYYGPLREDLSGGASPWVRLVGLHPPAHGILTASLLRLGGSVTTVVGLSVLLSLGSITLSALTLRLLGASGGGLLSAGALALSPYQTHYGVELNNYPMYLLGGAALVWASVRTLQADDRLRSPRASRLDFLLLGLAAVVTLSGHLAGLPIVAVVLVLFALQRRWTASAALLLALLCFIPTASAFLDMLGVASTFHNTGLGLGEVATELSKAWIGRFGSPVGLSAALVLIGLSSFFAIRHRARRGLIVAGGLLLLTATSTVIAGLWSGAANVAQTPYWILASWMGWTIVGLGWSSAPSKGRIVLGTLLSLWCLTVVAAGGLAGNFEWKSGEPGAAIASTQSADALARHLETTSSPDDAVVYLWEPQFLNDSPTDHDPLFSIFAPSDVGDWLGPTAPCRNYNFRWNGRSLCVRAAAGMRGGEHEETLANDLSAWLDSGTTVHLIQAGFDRRRAPPSSAGLRARLRPRVLTWEESRPGGIRVLRVQTTPLSNEATP